MGLEHGLTTTTGLLENLRQPGHERAWEEFDQRYRPVLERLARRFGLNAADAADVAQETMLQFFRDYRAGLYDRSRGRLRHWLLGIARNRIRDACRHRALKRAERGQSAIAALPSASELSALWELECRDVALAAAVDALTSARRVTPRTIHVFRRHVLEQLPAEAVARELGISVRSVYLAKHRCLARLRPLVAQLEQFYEFV